MTKSEREQRALTVFLVRSLLSNCCSRILSLRRIRANASGLETLGDFVGLWLTEPSVAAVDLRLVSDDSVLDPFVCEGNAGVLNPAEGGTVLPRSVIAE